MFCRHCGTEIQAGANFCDGCGTPLDKVSPMSEPSSGFRKETKQDRLHNIDGGGEKSAEVFDLSFPTAPPVSPSTSAREQLTVNGAVMPTRVERRASVAWWVITVTAILAALVLGYLSFTLYESKQHRQHLQAQEEAQKGIEVQPAELEKRDETPAKPEMSPLSNIGQIVKPPTPMQPQEEAQKGIEVQPAELEKRDETPAKPEMSPLSYTGQLVKPPTPCKVQADTEKLCVMLSLRRNDGQTMDLPLFVDSSISSREKNIWDYNAELGGREADIGRKFAQVVDQHFKPGTPVSIEVLCKEAGCFVGRVAILTPIIANPAVVPPPEHADTRKDFVHQMVAFSASNENQKVEEMRDYLQSMSEPEKGDRKAARSLNDQGRNLLKRGQYVDAIAFFEEAHRADKSDIEIANNLGYALMLAGRSDEAEAQLIDVLGFAPTRATAWDNLGQIYAKKGDIRSAVASFANAYRFSKNKTKTHQYFLDLLNKETDPQLRSALSQITQQAVGEFGLASSTIPTTPKRLAAAPATPKRRVATPKEDDWDAFRRDTKAFIAR